MKNLYFRRQFLLTPIKCEELRAWQTEKIDNHFLYVHPDCKLEKASGKNELFLIGYFFDPHNDKKEPKDILNEIAQAYDINNYPELLYRLVGRFVLIIKQKNDFIFFNDACGLKSLYYSKVNNNVYAASQPLLLAKVLDLRKTKFYEEYFNSNYVKKNREHWLPSGLTFYENVFHLVPNHYFKTSENTQKRFYPNKSLPTTEYKESVERFAFLLKKIMISANDKMDLAFSLTAGWDARILLSGSKDIIDDITFYTLKYRNMGDNHRDIKIPVALSKSLNLKHEIFDCQIGISEDFAEIYMQNTDMAHVNDWGKIAYGMLKTYPQDKIAVKGNCSEIGRCLYAQNNNHKLKYTENDIIQFESGWNELDFVKHHLKIWFDNISEKKNNYGYDLFVLFYWEHRMGSWQAQSQLEWDIVQEAFTPFNSRELLDLMLSIDPLKRKAHNPLLYTDAMKILWKDVLSEPINPISSKDLLRSKVVGILKKSGLLSLLKTALGK